MKKLCLIIFILLSYPAYSKFHFDFGGLKSIYSIDDRLLIDDNTDEKIKKLSRSVAFIFFKDDLVDPNEANNSTTIFSNLLQDDPPYGSNYCPTEKFASHHAYKKACSGFLVTKDILITAGHCFRSKNDCHRKLIAFDVRAEKETEKGFQINNKDIFQCSKILSVSNVNADSDLDFAIIQLDHKADRPTLKFREAKKIEDDASVYMIGHPLGLPLIYTSNAKVLDNSGENIFKATLDSFHGNSGSPVFNSTNDWVEGVLVSGEADEEYDREQKCNHYAHYKDDDVSKGEGVTRMTSILPFLRNGMINLDPAEELLNPDEPISEQLY